MISVMIVDDSRVARLSLRRLVLDIVPEAKVLEAASCDEALARLAEGAPDIALIDFNMPGRNGLELAEELSRRFPSIRLALVTANIQDALAQRARALGMTFIAKPPRPDEFAGFLLAGG